VWGWVWEMAPLLIYPLVYVIRQVAVPYTLWGAGLRVDQTDLYFSSSGYPSTFLGAVQFLLHGTYELFWELLKPGASCSLPAFPAIFLGGCGVLAMLALVQIVRGRAGRRAIFVALFLALALAGVALGGVLGVYPYGIARYTPFLTMPSLILIGLGGAWLYRWITIRLGTPRFWNALLIVVAAAVLAGATIWCLSRARQISRVYQEDSQAITRLQALQPDLILADNYISVVLHAKAPALYARVHKMGPGTYYGRGKDEVPPDMVDAIAGATSAPPMNSILVVLFPHGLGRTDEYGGFGQRYPLWRELIEKDFVLTELIESMHIEGRFYERK